MRFRKDQEQEEVEVEEEPVKRRAFKPRGPRKNRSFMFRGRPFFVKTDKGLSAIFTQLSSRGALEHQVTVRETDMMRAVRELAKIAIAEEAVAVMSVGGNEGRTKGN